ncbi:MAG: hypothetical protein EOP84_13680 [Verrucomicrobiaceae bacterium]|nr:MAG: hypothetical protein EOP84_13680 [Verrucomicrobiaceae bacterium]
MRNFIVLAEAYIAAPEEVEVEVAPEIVAEVAPSALILHDLDILVTRMRTFMESESGEYGLGVETGMQQAADMIENLIRRYNTGDHVE